MRDRWSKANVWLHWLSAAMIVGLLSAGFVMSALPPTSVVRLWLSRSHSLAGATLGVLTLARLAVRRRRAPPEPIEMSPVHRLGVRVVHAGLYAVILAIAATGIATAARSAWPAYVKGQLDRAPSLHGLASRAAHETLVFVLLVFVALHVGGAMFHQIRNGGVLRRMLPFLR